MSTINTEPLVERAKIEAFKKKELFFGLEHLQYLQKSSAKIHMLLKAGDLRVDSPLLSQFIGLDAVGLKIDARRSKFVVYKKKPVGAPQESAALEEGENEEAEVLEKLEQESIQFTSKMGKELITFLAVFMPSFVAEHAESPEHKAIERINLKGRLLQKMKIAKGKARETVFMASLKMEDVYVVQDQMILGKLVDYNEEEMLAYIMEMGEVDGESKLLPRSGISFYAAKDVRPERIMSVHSLFQKMTGSLSVDRFVQAKHKVAKQIQVVRQYMKDGMVLEIEEPQKAIVLDEMCTFDGNKLPFGDNNGAVLKAVFSGVTIVHREDGFLEPGTDVSENDGDTYVTYMRSMSQARANGAVGFRSWHDVITYLLGTGQDETAYSKPYKDKDGVDTGFNVMAVDAAYKRFMLAMSNGRKAETGLLSIFKKDEFKLEFFPAGERNVIGEIKPAYIVMTYSDGRKLTIALIEDFTAEIQRGNDFLVNRLDKTNAFTGVEKFNHWDDEDAIKALLIRNLTDGSGWWNGRLVEEARMAGIIHSNDACQIRLSNAVKGAVHQHDEMCDLFQADLVLTAGMVKAQEIAQDIRRNGFQLYVVGQRKEGLDGSWVASQASQQFGLTLPELKGLIGDTIDFTRNALKDKVTEGLLRLMEATSVEADSEFESFDFARLAMEFNDVANDQYYKDEMTSKAVRKLNKLLDSKFFVQRARNRYMFTDPIALLNAARDGRYRVVKEDCVLQEYEVVAPSRDSDGKYFMEEGEAVSVRFPMTISHEASLVLAKKAAAYQKYIDQGLWQGCVFYDAMTWVVAEQAGADHDGDGATLVFDAVVVAARKRKGKALFGGKPVLPMIDAYVKYVDGKAVEFKAGCPTYTPEDGKATAAAPSQEEIRFINGFRVMGYNIISDPEEFKGKNRGARRRAFVEVVADMARTLTVNTIESSLIGVIANRAMILTDLLSRNVLSPQERLSVEIDLMNLCVAGRWEIDRPKHGGAYMAMPVMENLFNKFSPLFFDEDQMQLKPKAKLELMHATKLHYKHIFGEVIRQGELVGYEVKKPQWLSSQKDEYGETYDGSLYQDALEYSRESITKFCEEFIVGHSDHSANNIRTRINRNMEFTNPALKMQAQGYVRSMYQTYTQKETVRLKAERDFMIKTVDALKEEGKFRKKAMWSLTKAKKMAKVRKAREQELAEFKMARDLYRAEFRKEMYDLAKRLDVDVRSLVGLLYLVVYNTSHSGTAKWRADGREFRFVASNGFISLPFEVFTEEMASLISGKVSETFFFPQDLTFLMIKSNLVPRPEADQSQTDYQPLKLPVRVANPNPKNVNTTLDVKRELRIAVVVEIQNDAETLMVYFLNKSCQKTDVNEITREDAAFFGYAPDSFHVGLFTLPVSKIQFNSTGNGAMIIGQ